MGDWRVDRDRWHSLRQVEAQVTAPRKPILTEEEIIESARSRAQEETKLMPDSTERDEHLEYAERDFEAGARFTLAAAEKREESIRILVRGFLNDLDKWKSDDELSMHPSRIGHYIAELRAALGIDKEGA